jgi:hypothetical protein
MTFDNLQRLQNGSQWNGHKVLFITSLFGKNYYWLRDHDGTIYLAKVGPDPYLVPDARSRHHYRLTQRVSHYLYATCAA